MRSLEGCDTFLVRPEATAEGWTVFGKNSDRPLGEVQEIVYEPPRKGPPGRPLKCTYVTIPDVGETRGVVLSRPAWLWGAEMGANDAGVVIGNEAVWTKLGESAEPKLLGMDLLRLGLERGGTAAEALAAMTALLETEGQGGPCAEDDPELLYHNSFLIADKDEAWILETAERHWAAVKVTGPYANISNNLTIVGPADRESAGARAAAQAAGYWDGQGDFVFGTAFAKGAPRDGSRQRSGEALLAEATKDGKFTAERMMNTLRNEESGICMGQRTTSSMVSILPKDGRKAVHFLTGTPEPNLSVFKPFFFHGDDTVASKLTISPDIKGDRGHKLWKANQAATRSARKDQLKAELRAMETMGAGEVVEALLSGISVADPHLLFHECADAEYKILSAHQ